MSYPRSYEHAKDVASKLQKLGYNVHSYPVIPGFLWMGDENGEKLLEALTRLEVLTAAAQTVVQENASTTSLYALRVTLEKNAGVRNEESV